MLILRRNNIMSDIRNNDLCKIIEVIFPIKCNDVDKAKKQVIIGKGKYATKCSFKEVDKEYYTTLFKYTFIIEGTTFVDKKLNNYKDFNRKTAVDNAIAYLESWGIVIKCTLYCESEKRLLARFIFKILYELLSVMFSFGKSVNEQEYGQKIKRVFDRYNREIVSKGIISLIYDGAMWSDVESYGEKEECHECLLIHNGINWRDYFNIRCIDTRLKLNIRTSNTNYEENNYYALNGSYECVNSSTLNNKSVPIIEGNFYYLDFFHLDNEYYLPSRFCYFTDVNCNSEDIHSETEKNKADDNIRKLSTHYTDHSKKRGDNEHAQAKNYLSEKYCSNIRKQYMNKIEILKTIISSLLKIKYKEFFSDRYKLSDTVFYTGLKQLTYFFEDHKISYESKDVIIIYKHLIVQWVMSFCDELKRFKIKEMFKYYDKKENAEYAKCIDRNRTDISKYKNLDILDSADDEYKRFCDDNKKLIDDFNKKIKYKEDVIPSMFSELVSKSSNTSFRDLKESIKDFKERLDWNVPYYLRIILVEGNNEFRSADILKGRGHIGETKIIDLIQDERYTIEGENSIKLSFDANIAEVKYILKAEYVQDQVNANITQESDINEVGNLSFKNENKYRIEFEALGISTAPFSLTIIRRTANNSFEIVFEKNDIKLSSSFESYSYEFTYNGENKDRYYFSFGYVNMIEEYNIRHLKLFKIE